MHLGLQCDNNQSPTLKDRSAYHGRKNDVQVTNTEIADVTHNLAFSSLFHFGGFKMRAPPCAKKVNPLGNFKVNEILHKKRKGLRNKHRHKLK